MKQIISGLLLASSLSMGQVPPVETPAGGPPATNPGQGQGVGAAQTTAAPVQTTTAPIIQTTAAPVQTTSAPAQPATTAAPVQTTQAPQSTATVTEPLPAATTAAPGPAIVPNPYCPAVTVMNKLGPRSNPTLPLGFSMNSQAECRSNIPGHPEARAIDYEGRLICNSWACCLCHEIICGASGWPCEQLKIADSGAVGAQNIQVIGSASGAASWTGFGWVNGADVDCAGLEACKNSKIRGKHVGQMQCAGDYGCQGADILYEATEESTFQCNGLFGCAQAKIEIVIPAHVHSINTIEFNGQQAAQGAIVTIRALGASALVQNLECMNPTACINTQFKVIGNVYFENCDLQGMQNLNTMPAIIQSCALSQAGLLPHGGPFGQGLLNNPNFLPATPAYQPPIQQAPPTFPQYPQYTYPLYPQQPAQPAQPAAPAPPSQPATPSTPVTPVTPAQPATPSTPATPARPQLPPLQAISSQGLKCLMNECANRAVTVQVSNNFVFECLGSCQNMDLTLNVGYDPMNLGQPVERIDSLKFIRPSSGMGATIRINTAGMLIEVNDIRCEGFGACRNIKMYVDHGVDIWNMNFDCNTPMECGGCQVFQSGSNTPIDCWTLNGNNNNMFGFGGSFLPQTPGYGLPAQPAQPAFPGYTYPQFI